MTDEQFVCLSVCLCANPPACLCLCILFFGNLPFPRQLSHKPAAVVQTMLLGRSVRQARNLPRRLIRGGIGIGIPTREHTGAWSRQQQRLFAGKGGDFFDDYDDVIHATSTGKSYTADDMEFFDELNRADFEDSYDQDQDQSDEEEEELEQRQQVRDELDQRKGRGWSDPWEITDEDFMQRRFLDDLPDWTPGLCSRISMDRVKIHPGTSTCLLFLCCFVVS